MRFKKGMPGKDYQTKKGNMDLGLNELRIRTASNVEEWKQDNPQAFEDTGYPQPKPNMKFPENRLHNPNNWDPKNYEEKYPDRPTGVSGISANSEFERKMDNDTKELLWRVMDENTQLKQENMMLQSKLNSIKRLL